MSTAGPVLPLVERFVSVQGEGFHAGRAAVFVRFAGCNLDCQFSDGSVCDTPWSKATEKVELAEVVDWAGQALPPTKLSNPRRRPMLIITGGEPTMARGFSDLALRANGMGYYVAVETNGTTWNDGLDWVHWIACSPKDQVQHGPRAHGSPALHPLVEEAVAARGEYRHVIGPDSPMPPVRAAQAHYLSPAMQADGSGLEWQQGVPGFVPGAVERCLELVQQDPRWRLSLQTHKWLRAR